MRRYWVIFGLAMLLAFGLAWVLLHRQFAANKKQQLSSLVSSTQALDTAIHIKWPLPSGAVMDGWPESLENRTYLDRAAYSELFDNLMDRLGTGQIITAQLNTDTIQTSWFPWEKAHVSPTFDEHNELDNIRLNFVNDHVGDTQREMLPDFWVVERVGDGIIVLDEYLHLYSLAEFREKLVKARDLGNARERAFLNEQIAYLDAAANK